MDKTIYITDLDGTLLANNRRLTPYTIQTINQLIKAGMSFSYATARSLTSARMVVPELDVKLPIISNNGTFIVDPKSGERIVSNYFTKQTVCEIREILEDLQANPLIYTYQDGEERISWIAGNETEGLDYYLNQRKQDRRMCAIEGAIEYGNENMSSKIQRRVQETVWSVGKSEDLYKGEVFYFTCIDTKENLAPIYHAVKDRNDINCIFHQELYRPEYWCEIMPKNATKANAIQQLKQRYQYDKVICFGDGENDIPMFQIADEAYAMENAVLELKEIATGIIGRNNEDGVAKWMLEHTLAFYGK